MNEPRYQFWRTIQPVEGRLIPDGAEFRSARHGCVNWSPCRGDGRFGSVDSYLEWRVPVEVVPIDLVADLLLCGEWWNGKYHLNCGDHTIDADTPEQLRELVVATLRKVSQESK